MILFEVGVIIAIMMLLAVLLLPSLLRPRPSRSGINCVNNLKQIGLAYRIWAGDNGDKYPMQVSVTNGGAMELAGAGNASTSFLVMSNELSTPKVVICPEDAKSIRAADFGSGFSNSNVSYFVGLDADDTMPISLLSGDSNLAIGGVPVKSGLLGFPTNAPIAWTAARHVNQGNIGLADGSVGSASPALLHQMLVETGTATNHLALP